MNHPRSRNILRSENRRGESSGGIVQPHFVHRVLSDAISSVMFWSRGMREIVHLES